MSSRFSSPILCKNASNTCPNIPQNVVHQPAQTTIGTSTVPRGVKSGALLKLLFRRLAQILCFTEVSRGSVTARLSALLARTGGCRFRFACVWGPFGRGFGCVLGLLRRFVFNDRLWQCESQLNNCKSQLNNLVHESNSMNSTEFNS